MSAKRSGAVIRNIIVGYCDNATIKNMHHKDSLSLEFYKCFDWIDGRFFFYVVTTPYSCVCSGCLKSSNPVFTISPEGNPIDAVSIRYFNDHACSVVANHISAILRKSDRWHFFQLCSHYLFLEIVRIKMLGPFAVVRYRF